MAPETTRKRLLRRLVELRAERARHERDWKTICEEMAPFRWSLDGDTNPDIGRLLTKPNGTPYEVVKSSSAGLMGGITSPAKPWYRLTTSDPEINEDGEVKRWLEKCEKIIFETLEKGSFYSAMSDGVYRDLLLVGTAVAILEEDDDTDVHFEPVPIGEYYIDTDSKGRVDTFYRLKRFSVRQLVDDFGLKQCSPQAQDMWRNEKLSRMVDVVQAIYPNSDYGKGEFGPMGMKWASCWFESKGNHEGVLREKGYHEFPVLAPRWLTLGTQPYGFGPGHFAVGDCLALRHHEKKLARMIDKIVDPPMRAVATMKTARTSLLPGDVTYVPPNQANAFEPAMEIPGAALVAVKSYIEAREGQIKDAFYYDLWRTLLADERNQRPTAFEVQAVKDEVMLQLGPVLEHLNPELLDPAITRTFAILERRGKLPPAPEALQGRNLRIQFISIMHAAQHRVGIGAVREVEQHVIGLMQAGMPEAAQMVNVDKLIESVGEMAGIDRSIIRTKKEVEELRAELARNAQAEKEGQAMLSATEGARNLSGVEPQQLREVMASLPAAASAQAGAA